MRIAIFDFDGTLYKKETFRLMMKHMKEHPIYRKQYKRFFLSMLPIYISYKLRLYPEGKMKERLMQLYISSFDEVAKQDLRTFFDEVAESMEDDFNQQVVSRLEEHTRDKVFTMLISGAFTSLLKSATKEYKFDILLGTEIPIKNKKIDGKTPIYHIQGNRKNEAIFNVLNGKEVDWENSFAYADSYSDLPVLKLVGHPVAVQPDAKLQAVADEKGWEIL